MSQFKNPSTGDVISIPDALDGMYGSRPEWQPYDPEADAEAYPEIAAAATAPAGATGDPAPTFDAAQPLAAGPAVALENIEDIKGEALESALKDLALDTKGTADEKRDRLADRLNEEINRG
jgi:hypothetical protein